MVVNVRCWLALRDTARNGAFASTRAFTRVIADEDFDTIDEESDKDELVDSLKPIGDVIEYGACSLIHMFIQLPCYEPFRAMLRAVWARCPLSRASSPSVR